MRAFEEAPGRRTAAERLESWKEIAAYLKRDVRTVQRWEKRESLPVHRHNHDKLATVYAYPAEIDSWWNNRRPRLEPTKPTTASGRRSLRWWLAAGGAVLASAAGVALWQFPAARWRFGGGGAGPSAGAMVRRVWAGSEVNLTSTPSPDGRYLSFPDIKTGALGIRELATGKTRHLTNGYKDGELAGEAVFSPDGKRLAYGWSSKGAELRLINMDGSGARVLYRDEALRNVEPNEWSPDGKSILALDMSKDGASKILLILVADGSARTLKTMGPLRPGRVVFSPDGRYIAYDAPVREDEPERDVYVLPAGGGDEHALITHPADDYVLGWAPDGTGILFASDRMGKTSAWFQPVSGGRPQGAPRLVRADLGPVSPIGFARNGTYYYGVWTGMLDIHVASIDPATGRLRQAPDSLTSRHTGSNMNADWSPDGQHLVYCSLPLETAGGSRRSIMVVRSLSTGAERRLTPRLNFILPGIRWSSDASILVSGWDTQHRGGLYRVDTRTGAVEVVLRGPAHIRQGELSPDGKSLYYNTNDAPNPGSRLVARELATGREETLCRTMSFASMALSPDGRLLAFSFDTELRIMPAAGGAQRQLAMTPDRIAEVAWTPDGRHVLFARRRGTPGKDATTELWRIPVDGGPAENLGLTMGTVPQMRCHPDGRRIAFNHGKPSAEVWAMDRFLP